MDELEGVARWVEANKLQLNVGLTWKEQVQSVQKRSFAGFAKLRRLKDVLPPDTKKKIYNAMGQGALWPMNIQLGLNIESALRRCIFNFCFPVMKLYEERSCLFNFLDSKIGNAEPAFQYLLIQAKQCKDRACLFNLDSKIRNAETAFSIFKL